MLTSSLTNNTTLVHAIRFSCRQDLGEQRRGVITTTNRHVESTALTNLMIVL